MTGSQKKRRNKGLTLVELLMAIIVLLPVFVGTMYVFVRCIDLSELSQNSSKAVSICKNKYAEIEKTPRMQIKATYNNVPFDSNELNGKGISYVDDSQTGILGIIVSYSWQQKNGRIMGEDKNLNGQIEVGEDINNNSVLDSPATLTTLF